MKMIKIDLMFHSSAEVVKVLAVYDEVIAMRTSPGPKVASTVASAEHVAEQDAKNAKAAKALAEQTAAPNAEQTAAASSQKPDESPVAGETLAEVSYADLKKSIMKLVAIDPKHMREIADSFGVKTFQGTTADVWPKAKKAVDDKIVALRG